MKKEMKVVVKDPGKKPEVKEISDDLFEIQETVGGLFEIVRPFEDKHMILVCNEEGVYRDCRPNILIGGQVIYGPLFICGEEPGEDGYEFTGLTDEQADHFMEVLG